VPPLFELPTALLEYLNLLQGVAVPLPSGLLDLYDCDYEIYNIVAQPYYTAGEPIHAASKQSHQHPTYVFII